MKEKPLEKLKIGIKIWAVTRNRKERVFHNLIGYNIFESNKIPPPLVVWRICYLLKLELEYFFDIYGDYVAKSYPTFKANNFSNYSRIFQHINLNPEHEQRRFDKILAKSGDFLKPDEVNRLVYEINNSGVKSLTSNML